MHYAPSHILILYVKVVGIEVMCLFRQATHNANVLGIRGRMCSWIDR